MCHSPVLSCISYSGFKFTKGMVFSFAKWRKNLIDFQDNLSWGITNYSL